MRSLPSLAAGCSGFVLCLFSLAGDARAQSLNDSLDAIAISHRDTGGRFDAPAHGYVNLVRWAFPEAWGFPAGGFDVYRCCDERRQVWVQINTQPIYPIEAPSAQFFETPSPLPEPRFHADDGRRVPPVWRVPPGVAADLSANVAQLTTDPVVVFDPEPGNTQTGGMEDPSLTRLQMLLMASLYPRFAFAVGLLLADYDPAFGSRCTYRIVGHWAQPRGDQVVHVGPVQMGVEPPLPVPAGLTGTLIPGPPGSVAPADYPEAIVPDTTQVGLSWSLPTLPEFGRYPPEPLLWHVYRSDFLGPVGSLPPACPLPDTAYAEVTLGELPDGGGTTEAPILVSPRVDSAGEPLLDANGQVLYPRYFYVDRFADQLAGNAPPLPDYGWYCWRLQGQDIFGRRTPLAATMRLEVRDHIAPPPPQDLCAVVGLPEMQPYQPIAASASQPVREAHRRSRCATLPDARGVPRFQELYEQTTVTLRWRWTDAQEAEAPDAEAFEVYRRLGEDSALPPDGSLPNTAAGWALVAAVDKLNPPGGRIQDDDPTNPGGQRWNYQLPITITKNTASPDCRDLHHFRLVTRDENGNRSLPTPVGTGWVIDKRPPQPPGEARILYSRTGAQDLQVHVLIPASSSADVVGYKGYRAKVAPSSAEPTDDDYLLNGTLVSAPTDVAQFQTLADTGNLFEASTGSIHSAVAVPASAVPALAAGTVYLADSVPRATTTTTYHWHAVAEDGCANVSSLSVTHAELTPDWDPPSPPVITSGLGAEKGVAPSGGESRSVVELVWAGNPEPDVTGYVVYRSEGLADCVPITSTIFVGPGDGVDVSNEPLLPANAVRDVWRSPAPNGSERARFHFRDQDVRPLRLYRYVVRAIDNALNLSNASQEMQVSTFDLTPPEDPTDITGTVAPGRVVTITWLAEEEDLRARVQRAITPFGPFETVNDSDLELSSVPEGSGFRYAQVDTVPITAPDTVYYRVQLIDISGNESAPVILDTNNDTSADPVGL